MLKRTSLSVVLLSGLLSFAQKTEDCKVTTTTLSKRYEGECKKGFANGKGEAWGEKDHYVGEFKKGSITGKGVYYYGEDMVYTGTLQEGIKEGKGEMLYKIKSKDGIVKDSLVQGYWSGDIFRGKTYTTYKLLNGSSFASYDISPSNSVGDIITIEVSSTSGIPATGNGIFVSSIDASYDSTKGFSKIVSTYASNNSSFTNIQIGGFPVKLRGRLTDGSNFELELYKAATWKVKFFINK
jgi:hypothetical protein